MVRFTERHAFGDQVIRQLGGVGIALLRRFLATRAFHLNAVQHQRRHMQTVQPGVERIEQPFFVFLHIFVVGQRQPFQGHHHAGQRTLHAATLATDQLQRIRVFLLRHQGRAGGHTIGQLNKTGFARVEEDQVFGEARQMHHTDRRIREQLQHVVTVGDAVQAVAGGRSKAQPAGKLFTVDFIRRTGQCAAAQRANVQTL